LITFASWAQGEANYWYFGQYAGLDFNSIDPVPISGSLSTNEGCATFSDKDGNLLFYTDGIKVWNSEHQVMPGGSDLLGNPSSTQSGIIVPHPGEDNKFYIFTVGSSYDERLPGLNGYVVDMTQDNGLGAVVEGPIDLSDGLSSDWTEKVTSVKGAECHTFWVISLVHNRFYAYKVDEDGLHTDPVISTVGTFNSDVRGYLKVSPDGKKLASAIFNTRQNNQTGAGSVYMYSFDDATGKVANDGIGLITDTAIDGEPYGVEFSPASNMLYVSTFDAVQIYKLFQFDLEATNIPGSKFQLHTERAYSGGLQLAPNGKIYATIPPDYFTGTPYLDVINFPDEKGAAAGFQLSAINLSPGRAMQGLPPFIASLLLPVEITDGVSEVNINNTTVKRCIGEDYHLSAENIAGDPSYRWFYKDSIISTAPVLNLPSLSVAMEGLYSVEIETVDECDFKILYKGEVNLEVYQPPTISPLTNVEVCDDDHDGLFQFDLKALKEEEVLMGQDSAVFEVVFFNNLLDAENNENTLGDTYINVAPHGTEQLFARIHNIQNPICYEIETFDITVFEIPNPPASISTLGQCDATNYGTDTDGFEYFDLTVLASEILNGQNPSVFELQYFEDQAYSNEIGTPGNYLNAVRDGQTVYVRITNVNAPDCYHETSFEIVVHALPTITDQYTIKQCDEDGSPDGFTTFNLNEINEFLSADASSMTITHHLTQVDADQSINAIPSFPYTNQNQNQVFARVENANGCHRVAVIDLIVSSTSFPDDYLKVLTSCDDDEIRDGLRIFDLSPSTSEIMQLFPTGQNLEVSYYTNLTDAQLETNPVGTDGTYFMDTPISQTLFVRVESLDNGECFGLGPHLQLNVSERPDFELDPSVILCHNLPPITVETYNPTGDFTYSWYGPSGQLVGSGPNLVVDTEGEYTVVATSASGCDSFPHVIEVLPSSIAFLNYSDLTIVDDALNNSILVDTSNLGIGDYEFALNEPDGVYQDDPYFDGLLPGIHTLYIRDKNNCGTLATEVSVLGYPKFFTPNFDGHNDRWAVLGVSADFYRSATIYIFDRFGKLVANIDLHGNGWDGSFNGEILPASDYWFSVFLEDLNGNTREKKGHFSLIRR
jgi:gliding motility-associated-like protein